MSRMRTAWRTGGRYVVVEVQVAASTWADLLTTSCVGRRIANRVAEKRFPLPITLLFVIYLTNLSSSPTNSRNRWNSLNSPSPLLVLLGSRCMALFRRLVLLLLFFLIALSLTMSYPCGPDCKEVFTQQNSLTRHRQKCSIHIAGVAIQDSKRRERLRRKNNKAITTIEERKHRMQVRTMPYLCTSAEH